MTCSTCKHPFALLVFLRIHWIQTGCQKGRDIWKRVFEAKRRGTSGKRILRAAYPNVYKTKPMSPEWLARLRSMKEESRG
ncbi:MAG TPA: hypothetical protein VG457_08975 [Planctomycetota bacterium]|jgi:hypothetical protein|nr:hypothetical protein [Planctomycetota bacterium]